MLASAADTRAVTPVEVAVAAALDPPGGLLLPRLLLLLMMTMRRRIVLLQWGLLLTSAFVHCWGVEHNPDVWGGLI